MTGADWADPNARAIAIYLDGSDDPDRADDGTPLVDDDFLVLVNAWWEPLDVTLPATRPEADWQVEIDTYDLEPPAGPRRAPQGRRSRHRRPPLRRRTAQPGPEGVTPGSGSAQRRRATCRAAPQWRRRVPDGRPARRRRISPYSRSRCHGAMAI